MAISLGVFIDAFINIANMTLEVWVRPLHARLLTCVIEEPKDREIVGRLLFISSSQSRPGWAELHTIHTVSRCGSQRVKEEPGNSSGQALRQVAS